jgi:signal transduction histidine kinase/CheY-like chemotaxis protein/HPt (histidine-containing phosphotransfer) domain-containing protein
MSTDKQKKYAKYFLYCIAVYLGVVIGYSCWYAHQAQHRVYSRIDDQLLLAARGLRYMLAEDFHDRTTDAEAISYEEEMRNRWAMNNYSLGGKFKYVYTLTELNGKFYFSAPTVTPEEARERPRWYFYPYPDIPQEFVKAYKENQVQFVTYKDQWGIFRSIALPETSPGGRRYLSCADFDISFVTAQIKWEYFRSLMTAIFFLLPAVPLMLVYRRYNNELICVNNELISYQGHLEEQVAKRTAELKKARDIAEQANRLKSRFVFNISHEIRTPMNGLIGFCEAILDSEEVDDIHNYARTILKESEVLLTLINDLLDVAKIEAGKMELDIHAFDLWGLLEEISSVTEVRTRRKGLEFNIDMNEEIPRYVRGDSLRLRQILVNLISNSLKFTDTGSIKVKVQCLETNKQSSQLRFSVIDTGIGIPKEKQSRIFESFTQADVSTTRKYGGTGLGTSIARQLIGLMKGAIGLESEPGKGSTFWFEVTLETTTAAQVRAEMSAGAAAPVSLDHQVGKILLADDYMTNQQIIKLFLEQEGHNLVIVENGLEAVKACQDHKFDLIFMDLQMPQMDGAEATKLIRQSGSPNANVPIIALTASGEASTQQLCLQSGMSDFLVKPIRRNVLISVVDRWLTAINTAEQAKAAKVLNAKTASGPLPIDLEMITKELEEKELIQELLMEFLHTTQDQLRVIGEAIERKDFQTIRQESHNLQGGAGSLAAGPLADLAGDLESQSREQKTEKMAQTFHTMEQEFERVCNVIDDYIV